MKRTKSHSLIRRNKAQPRVSNKEQTIVSGKQRNTCTRIQEKPKKANYEVGYRRPPKATQFKAGTSGNPDGRPKGSRPVGTLLQDILRQRVSVAENGKIRTFSTLEVMLHRLKDDAMQGDQKAIKFLLSLTDRYAGSPETAIQLHDILAEDEEILAQYLGPSAGSNVLDPLPPKSQEPDDAL